MANPNQTSNRATSNRGFASMDENQQREIARKGGQSVAPENRSFARDHDLARSAGAKGGHASHSNRSSGTTAQSSSEESWNNVRANSNSSGGNDFSSNPDSAREAGRKGGHH